MSNVLNKQQWQLYLTYQAWDDRVYCEGLIVQKVKKQQPPKNISLLDRWRAGRNSRQPSPQQYWCGNPWSFHWRPSIRPIQRAPAKTSLNSPHDQSILLTWFHPLVKAPFGASKLNNTSLSELECAAGVRAESASSLAHKSIVMFGSLWLPTSLMTIAMTLFHGNMQDEIPEMFNSGWKSGPTHQKQKSSSCNRTVY